MKKSLKQRQGITFVLLLSIGVALCVVATLLENAMLLKATTICISIIFNFLITIMTIEIVKDFKEQSKHNTGSKKIARLIFWNNSLFIISGAATYLFMTLAIHLMSAVLMYICVVCAVVFVLTFVIKIILFVMQKRAHTRGLYEK